MKSSREILGRLRASLTCVAIAGVVLLAFGAAPAIHAEDDCKVVFDAGDKLTGTPHHGYTTRTLPGGKTEVTEDISVDGAIYVQVRGKWVKSPLTVKQRQADELENRKLVKNKSCHFLREETVSGQAAKVYSAHAETEEMKSDVVVWIAKSSGLILRQEEDMETSGEKYHSSVRFEYSNVKAPIVP